MEEGNFWNRLQYPLVPVNSEEVYDYQSQTAIPALVHSSGLFYVPNPVEKDPSVDANDNGILLAASAFNIIAEEVLSNEAGQKGPSDSAPRGRTLVLDERFEHTFLNAFFNYVKSAGDPKMDATRWKESTPAVGFIFEVQEGLLEDSLMEILHNEELKMADVSIALSMVNAPSINKYVIADELERRRNLSVHISTITGMEVLSVLREYEPLRALIKNALYTLTRAFKDWHMAKTAVRREFMKTFNSQNVFYQKLLNSTPLCKGLFPSGLMDEIRKIAENRIMGSDQLLKINDKPVFETRPRTFASSYRPSLTKSKPSGSKFKPRSQNQFFRPRKQNKFNSKISGKTSTTEKFKGKFSKSGFQSSKSRKSTRD